MHYKKKHENDLIQQMLNERNCISNESNNIINPVNFVPTITSDVIEMSLFVDQNLLSLKTNPDFVTLTPDWYEENS